MMNYAETIHVTNKEKNSKKNNFKNNRELLNNGYAIIRRNKETQKIEIFESDKTKEKKERLVEQKV